MLVNRGGGAGRSVSALSLSAELSARGVGTLLVPDARHEVLRWAFSGMLRPYRRHLPLDSRVAALPGRRRTKAYAAPHSGFHVLSRSPVYNHFLDEAGAPGRAFGPGGFAGHYDLAVVDTAPGFYRFPEEVAGVLNAAEKVHVAVPLASDFRALDLAEDALGYFEVIREYFPRAEFAGAFLTLDRPGRDLGREILAGLSGPKPCCVFDTVVPYERALVSTTYDRPLREALPHSPVTAAYSALAHEIATMLGV